MPNYELGSLIWRVKGDATNFDKSISSSQASLKKFSNAASKVGKNLTKFVTAPLAALGGVAVKSASDLSESLNAVNVVFGDAAGAIESFGETASDAAGLSQNSFNELATVIGAQLKQSGADIDTVADQTVELTQRSADLASVFNVDVKEATGALGAALRGETEPARRFGVNISDAAVQAEALASGLVSSRGEITEQIKVQARYNLIMDQSAQVAGDFQNTSDGLANQTRILRADLENVAAELGEAFLPIVTDVVSGVRDAVQWFSNLDDGTKRLITALGIIAAASGPVIGAVGAIGKLKAAIVKLNTTALFGPAGIIVGIVALSTALIGLGRARRRAQLEELEGAFKEIEEVAGLTGEQIDRIGEALRFNQLSREETAEEIVARIAQEVGVTRSAVLAIGIESDALTDSFKEQLRVIKAENDTLVSAYSDYSAAREQAVEDAERIAASEEAAAEAARLRAEQMDEVAASARLEAEERFSALLRELDGQTEIQRIEAERTEGLRRLADQYVRSGEAVDLLNEYYDTLIEQEKELQEQRADEKQAEEAERLSKLRLELFGTETERFEAGLAERIELYREVGLEEEEIERAIAEQRKEFTDQMIANSRREVDERLRAIRDGYEEQREETEGELSTLTDLYGNSWDDRVRQSEEGYEEFRRLRREDLEDEQEAYDEKVRLAEAAFSVVNSIISQSFDLRMMQLDNELEATRQSYDAQIAELDRRLEAELAAAGLAEKTAVETAQAELDAAIESGDKEAIAKAEDELEKAQIEEEYAKKRLELEKEQALALYDIQLQQFEAQKKMDIIEAGISTARMAIEAYQSLVGIPVVGPILAAAAAAAATGFGLAQISAIQSQPTPPKPSFALGGQFVTNGPQEILVGDNPGGRERVTVEPVSSPGREPTGSGVTVVVNTALNTDSQKNMERAARVLLPYLQREEARRG